MAMEKAEEYQKVISSHPNNPIAFRTVEYEPEYFPEPPISARITDVVDQSLVPSPLRFSKSDDSDRASSQYSGNAKNGETERPVWRRSIRTSREKSFPVSKISAEEKKIKRALSAASAKYPHMNLQPPPWRERLNSVASQQRASMHQGPSNVYETLRRLSSGSGKSKHISTAHPKKRVHIPRELRSPAIPVTAYQTYGTKAWEKSPKSLKSPKPKLPKQKSPEAQPSESGSGTSDTARKKGFPLLPKTLVQPIWQSVGGKGREKHSSKGKASEKRREELKKKIVVIGLADQYPDGRVSQWM